MVALVLNAAAPATSPWAVPVVTFAGVVLAQFVIVALYFAGRRADDRRRWHDKRLEAYSSFTSRFREMYLYLTTCFGLLSKGEAIDEERISVLYEQVGKPFFDIMLLGTDPVRRSGDAVIQELAWFDLVGTSSAKDWAESLGRAFERKEAFDKEVRKELGIAKPARRLVVQADGVLGLLSGTFGALFEVYAEAFRAVGKALGIRLSRRK